jgi:hypothetical protein
MRNVSCFELPATNGALKSHCCAFTFQLQLSAWMASRKQYRARRKLSSDNDTMSYYHLQKYNFGAWTGSSVVEGHLALVESRHRLLGTREHDPPK